QGIITHENLMGNGNWNTRTVARILHAQVYTGDLVQGRTKIVDHQQVEASEMEWTVVHDTHEAIISHELFETVQIILEKAAQQSKERVIREYTPNILKGKVFCACCGGSLHRQRNIRKKSADVYNYYCLTNSRVGKERCPGVFIRENDLLDSLADMLQNALETALGSYSLSLVELPQQTAERTDLKEKIASRKQEIQRLNGLIRSLYENLIQGLLSKEEYITYKGKYESRIQQLTEEVAHLEKGLKALDKQIAQYRALKRDSDDLRENRELTAALIDRLIDRIEITKDKQITVHYRFESEFDSNEEVLNRCKNM
ncbi:MAG: recombinase family protein, partial [Faecousia sp.]